jgi:sugar lactone lactonase YvrE
LAILLLCLTACNEWQSTDPREAEESSAESASDLLPAELLLELPDNCNTPDALCLLPDGNVILSVPNVNDKSQPSVLMKITPDNKAELFYTLPPHPETGKAYSLGVCTSPSGDLYVSDNQEFDTLENKSRVLRIPMKDGKPGEAVTVVSGLVVANAVLVRDGYLYVSDSKMVPNVEPYVSGVFRFKVGEEGVELKNPGTEDPHLIATLETHNSKIPIGADGLTFDNDGNLYVANFGDATVEKIEFDEQGEVKKQALFAKADFIVSADGLFFDTVEEKLYLADLMGNAIHVISMDGTVKTLARNDDFHPPEGRLDAPSEALLRGREVIVSNMDFPFAYTVNKQFGMPATLSVIRLPEKTE